MEEDAVQAYACLFQTVFLHENPQIEPQEHTFWYHVFVGLANKWCSDDASRYSLRDYHFPGTEEKRMVDAERRALAFLDQRRLFRHCRSFSPHLENTVETSLWKRAFWSWSHMRRVKREGEGGVQGEGVHWVLKKWWKDWGGCVCEE